MAQRGRSDWERQHATQRRETERQAREMARQAKEQARAQQAQHLLQQQRLAESKTAALANEAGILDQILLSVLNRPAITFAQLKVRSRPTPFQPRRLAEPPAAPRWGEFARSSPVVSTAGSAA